MAEIKKITEEIYIKWDEYVDNHPDSNFFQLSGWKKVIEQSFPYKPHYYYLDVGGKIKGILPLFFINSWFSGKFLISVPFGVYGGILADNYEISKKLHKKALSIARELEVDFLELRSEKKNAITTISSELYFKFQQKLYDDPEKNWTTLPKETRRLVRRAREHGLCTSFSRENLNDFYHIYCSSVRNLGTPVFSKKYFKNILQSFPDSAVFSHVLFGDKIITSMLNFHFKDRVMPYYIGGLKEYFKLNSNNIMFWDVIEYGIKNNYKLVDFGRSKANTGAYHFKRHFGMKPQPLFYHYDLIKAKEKPQINPTNPSYKRMINAWKKMPLRVTKLMGPIIIRNFP